MEIKTYKKLSEGVENSNVRLFSLRTSSVTADFDLNNRFKSIPVLGSFCFPLAKQDSRISKVCIFQFVLD